RSYSKESELNCWHYDHNKGCTVKGINLLSAVLATDELALPIGVEFIRKPNQQIQPDGQVRRRREVTQNEMFRRMLRACWQNCWFESVAADRWFSGTENMDFNINALTREFVKAGKSNRLAATSEADKQAGRWAPINALAGPSRPQRV